MKSSTQTQGRSTGNASSPAAGRRPFHFWQTGLWSLGGLLLASPAGAADLVTPTNAPATAPQLTVLAAGVQESYNNNVLMVADKTPGLPQTWSWITTVSPRVGVNFAPWFGAGKALPTLSLAYSPDFVVYHNDGKENHFNHGITNVLQGQAGDFSYSLKNAFLFVDGNSTAPIYALSPTAKEDYNVYAIVDARQRRKQIQERPNVVFQYDWDNFFIRPTAQMSYWDMMTGWRNNGAGSAAAKTPGYLDYVDRADVNGGLDLGYHLTADLSATLGYRYGHQYQESFPAAINTMAVNGHQAQSSSDYERILPGLEGKPWSWLTGRLSLGPDFRNYNPAAPVANDYTVTYYGEGSLTATITTNQSITLAYKHWRWESSIGRIPDNETSYDLAYRCRPVAPVELELAALYDESDYTVGSAVLSQNYSLRDDAMYTLSAGINYEFNDHFSANLGYVYNLGRNEQDKVATGAYRRFDQQMVTLGVVFRY